MAYGREDPALEWLGDGQRYSASGLAEHIIREATGGASASVNGAEWWALDDDSTLAVLAGLGSPRKDWSALHGLLQSLQPGEWTTYGELATAVKSHPIAVGQHIAGCGDCDNAWRVLGVDGHPRPNFAWTDPNETRSCRQVLEDEGIDFTGTGAADIARRVTGAQLAAR